MTKPAALSTLSKSELKCLCEFVLDTCPIIINFSSKFHYSHMCITRTYEKRFAGHLDMTLMHFSIFSIYHLVWNCSFILFGKNFGYGSTKVRSSSKLVTDVWKTRKFKWYTKGIDCVDMHLLYVSEWEWFLCRS